MTMTSRERMMVTMRNRQPDMVPVAPDISNMISSKLTGKPFWDVYARNNPPLWKAYIDAVKYFGFDGWFIDGELEFKTPYTIKPRRVNLIKEKERWIEKWAYQTPAGDLTEEVIYPVADPPTRTKKMVKDFERDFPRLLALFPEPLDYDDTVLIEQKKELGELGVLGAFIECPGFHVWVEYFQGSLEALTYAYYDYPEHFEELRQVHEKHVLRKLEMFLDAGIDHILTVGSGSITLQSPTLFDKLTLPTFKKVTRMCKEAGVISGVHSCGKEMHVIKRAYEETDLNYINPLEIPPMGDTNLKEANEKYGDKLCLMGNLHTTKIMLHGSPEDVEKAAKKAIDDAAAGGGFILSTGDQCGRDTPEENIRTLIRVARTYGKYTN
jgi:uroporphyrinogen decarboxylase